MSGCRSGKQSIALWILKASTQRLTLVVPSPARTYDGIDVPSMPSSPPA